MVDRKPAKFIYRVTGNETSIHYGDFQTRKQIDEINENIQPNDINLKIELVEINYVADLKDDETLEWIKNEGKKFLEISEN